MFGESAFGEAPFGAQPSTTTTNPPPDTGGPLTFTPSLSRTVKVLPGSRAFVATGDFWDMSNPKKPRGLKDPNSTIDISIDWTDWLADCQDTAATFSWTQDNGVTKVDQGNTAGLATVFLSLGNLSTVAAITCRMTTASTPPRTEDRTIYLTIEDR
jgi:hypothetical protein